MVMVVTAKELERIHTHPSNEELHYQAHIEELESAVRALVAGEDDFEFSFDLTSWDKQYLGERLHSILGRDFVLDFH